MNRRNLLLNSIVGVAGVTVLPRSVWAAQSTPSASPASSDYPVLTIGLKDDGFEIDNPIQAGRYNVVSTNLGTSTASHFALGRIPEETTDEEYQQFLENPDAEDNALKWDDIGFVGVPDWPQPGVDHTGVIDLKPGRYMLFDPFDARGVMTIMVEGDFGEYEEPASDLEVVLKEMEIDLPETAYTSDAVRWKITNTGAFLHEVAMIPVSPDFTEEDLQVLFTLPDDENATPPPGVTDLVYQPAYAIGILGRGITTWLDVELDPGHYLAICMLPFGSGYPHAMDGMYSFFEVK